MHVPEMRVTSRPVRNTVRGVRNSCAASAAKRRSAFAARSTRSSNALIARLRRATSSLFSAVFDAPTQITRFDACQIVGQGGNWKERMARNEIPS